MYAAKRNSHVYHHVRAKSGETYCGISVNKLLLNRPSGLSLHLVKDRPAGRSLCQHCAKAENPRGHSQPQEADVPGATLAFPTTAAPRTPTVRNDAR
jgi:hypothetical protein